MIMLLQSYKDNKATLRSLLKLAIPIIIGGLAQTGYHLINSFWVGRLGANAVAAISICMPINLLLISLGSGLALGGSILIAQRFGARDADQVRHIAAQTLTTMIAIAVVLSLIGYAASPAILHAMGVEAGVYLDALHYLRISFFGVVFLFVSSAYQSILRGVGETKAPLRIIFSSVLLNAALDPLLIFGYGPVFPMGVSGAAYATLITQLVASIAGIRLMLKPRFEIRFARKNLLPDWSLIGRIFKLGLPASIEQSAQALTITVMTVFAAKFGTVVLATYGMSFRITTFLMIVPFGMSVAVSILVGHSIGAQLTDRARQISVLGTALNFLLMSLLSVVIYCAANPILKLFVPTDELLVTHATTALRIFSISFGLAGIQLGLGGAFRGAGATLFTMLLTVCSAWAVQLPVAFVLSRFTSLGELGLWWASPITSLINTVIALAFFMSGRWLKD